MAIDPTELSIQQVQRSAMDQAGAPTEFAQGPEQGTQVAFGGAFKELLEKLGRNVITWPSPEIRRVPTPQERRLLEDIPTFSERGTQQRLAPEVLSPQGVQTFEQRGFQAPAPNAPGAPGVPVQPDVVTSAAEALDQQAAEATIQADAIRTDATTALGAEQRGAAADVGVAPEALADPIIDRLSQRDLQIKSLADGGDFNFDYLETTDDVMATITAVGETFADAQTAVKRGVITNDATIESAAKLAEDELGLTRRIINRKTGQALNAEELVAAREIMVRSARRLSDLAQGIKDGTATAADRLAFRRQLAIHAGIQLQIKGAQTEAARALQSFQIKVSGEMDAARINQQAADIIKENGLDETTDALAQRVLQTGNLPDGERLAALNSLAERGWAGRTTDMIGEAYMAGLLSSPSTQFKNILGTVSFMGWQLPEEMLAGAWGSAIRKIRGPQSAYALREDQVYVADAMFRLKGWIDSVGDAFRIASVAYRTEIPTEMMNKLDYNVGAIRWAGGDKNSIFARTFDELGKRARIPFRFLLAGDEFFKTVSQRGELYVAAHRRYQSALRSGMDGQTALDEDGMVLLDPRSVAEDINYKGRYDTMTLDTGALGKLARQVQDIPVLGRIVLPFATAPTNDMLRTLERLPIPIGGQRLYSDLLGRNGPRAQQLAMGRWALGSATFAYVATNLTAEGRITGAMPNDPKVRDALPPGWQPYSIVLRGEGFPRDASGDYLPLYDEYGRPNGPLNYINYAGYGPVSSVVGLAASIPQSIAQSRDPEAASGWATAAVGAVAEYYKELPMLQGISQLFDFSENFNVENIARGPASVATPVGIPSIYSSLQRGIARAADPVRVTPRDDLEYYTMADADAGFVANDPMFTNPDGTINYRLVGTPKGDLGTQFRETLTMMRAYQQQDSMFADERDLNAVRYDTLGNVVGAEDISFSSRPGLALWNLTTGLVVKPGRELTVVENELMRLAQNTGGWPLTNPNSVGGIKLSAGAQSDLVRIAKNEVILNPYGNGFVDFREALEQLTFTGEYTLSTDQGKRTLVRNLNQKYIDAGFQTLLQLPDYANLRQAYEDAQALKEQGIR